MTKQAPKQAPQDELIGDLIAASAAGGVAPGPPEPAPPPPEEAEKKPRKKPEANPITLYDPARCGHADCRSTDILKKHAINRDAGIFRVFCRSCGRYSVIRPRTTA